MFRHEADGIEYEVKVAQGKVYINVDVKSDAAREADAINVEAIDSGFNITVRRPSNSATQNTDPARQEKATAVGSIIEQKLKDHGFTIDAQTSAGGFTVSGYSDPVKGLQAIDTIVVEALEAAKKQGTINEIGTGRAI